ncbi:MAG: acetyltransferase [Nitrospira sp.]|nr:MAG: acetyltransferase [Nitrospira sp.]
MAKPVYLLGGGGHGRVVLDALLSSAVNVVGILDSGLKVGARVFGVPVLGSDEFLDQVAPTDVLLVNGLGANPYVRNRKRLFEDMRMRGFSFEAVRHPSSVIGLECSLSESSQIMSGVVLQSQARIGDNVVINTHASVDHDCIIGMHSFVSPGVVLSGDVLVGESTFIGAGAVVLPGIQIGTNVIISAGAVVIKSVPDNWIVAGNPAAKVGINK